MVETKLIPTTFRTKETIGTKICTAVWWSQKQDEWWICGHGLFTHNTQMLHSGTWSPMVTTMHAQCFIFL